MKTYHPTLPKIPPRIANLAVDHRGYPVPWFVAVIDGKPDFRVADRAKFLRAMADNLCWVCGGKMGKYRAFTIGPMCAVNRVSGEPPSHRDCAEFSASACPFLVHPKKLRGEGDLPEGSTAPGGVGLARNPGVALVWITDSYKAERTPTGPILRIGRPLETLWYAHGRAATREEVLESIETGLPILQQMAAQEGPRAIVALNQQVEAAMHLIPA